MRHRVPEHIRYIASRSDAEHFGKELFALATNIGIYKETITNQENRRWCGVDLELI